MKQSLIYQLISITAAIMSLGFALSGSALAHGGRHVGDYEFNVGFMSEPVYEGQLNGVDLRVENTAIEAPVLGLEQTVRVEVTHVGSGQSKMLELEAVRGEPGRYTAALIPTAPGEYQFRFVGDIEGVPLNETFVSGADEFSAAESSKALQIPEQQLELREIGAAVRGATTAAEQAQDSAATATALAIAGLVMAGVGLGVGAGAMLMTRKRRHREVTSGGNQRAAMKG